MGIIEQCSKELEREREDIDNFSERLFRHASRLAQQSDTYYRAMQKPAAEASLQSKQCIG